MTRQVTPSQPPKSDRIPPYSEEAERGVLGSALLDPARVVDLCLERGVKPEAFYVRSHQALFEVLLGMSQENRPIDLLTLGDRLKALGRIEEVGGAAYLERLVDSTPTSAHADYYIDLVHQKWLLRMIIDRSREAVDLCYSSEEDAQAVLGKAEQAIFEISNLQRSSMAPWSELIKGAMQEIELIYQTKKGFTGIPTGYPDLDQLLLGFKPSEMIILAARPSMGKTSLALCIAENVSTVHRDDPVARPVAVFSLEMSADQLVRRMLCCRARVPSHKLTGGYINKVNHGELVQAADALMKAPLFLDDTAGLEVLELRSRARRLKRKYDVGLIVIDYLQMMNFPQYGKEGRQRETAAISGAIKAMAKELNVPVLVLSQLSRAPETRDKLAVPRLSDLRDSGSLEQDADVVLLLRRPCKYPDDEEKDDETLAVVEVAKHRNGPTGMVRLNFEEACTRFTSRAKGVDETPFEPPTEGADL
ncbi:MAG: replicative DNA helicase [Kiritimatiellae bacterium]|nr:replicative DNA helicase [Kiritimatiellia bacterium]